MSETGTVLYIDDERQLPAGFEEALLSAGYRLRHTADPDEALMLVRVEEIDLVLAEIVLSSCYGLALLNEIRSYGGWPAQVPIIVLTKGERAPELYGGALEMGVKEFFTKPAQKRELLESVLHFAETASGPVDVDPSEPSSAPESEAAMSGDLARIPISEVLRRLRREAASGVLVVSHRRDRRAFELRNGSPSVASASGGVEALEDFLTRRGRISRERRQAVKERVRAGGGSSRDVIIDLGVLSKRQLAGAIREQAEEQLLETFRWTAGTFHYFPDKHVRVDVALDIDRDQASLMLEGVRRWSPDEVVAEALRPRAWLYVSRVEEPLGDPAELDLSSSERVFFEHLYGDRGVREVLESGDLSARTLYGLFAAGLLVLHEEPVMMLLDTAPVAEEAPQEIVLDVLAPEPLPPVPPVRDTQAPERPRPTRRMRKGRKAKVAAPEPPPPEEPELEPLETESPILEEPELEPLAAESPILEEPEFEPPPAESLKPAWNPERALAELTAFCEHIRNGDDFHVLGVSEKASDAEVRHAYEGLLEMLPSEGQSLELPGLKEVAEEARKRLDQAFEHLKLASSRKVYAQLRQQIAKGRQNKGKKVEPPKTPEQIAAEKAARFDELASRGLDAEAWFRRGHGFLKLEEYESAVEAFGMAAHLDPREGEYLAHLGYAQFLNKPKDAVVLQEALENLARAIKLAPTREKPYVYLGKIFLANGAADRAAKMFKNALYLRPDCHEAQLELRLLSEQQEKPGKLLGRLKRMLD